MHVAHGSLNGAMTQQFFYRMQISAIIYKMCGKAMADSMHRIILTVKPKVYQCLLHEMLNAPAHYNRPANTTTVKQVFPWLIYKVVCPKLKQYLLAQNSVAVFGTLALYYLYAHVLAVYIRYLQMRYLTDTQAAAIKQNDNGAVLNVLYRIYQ